MGMLLAWLYGHLHYESRADRHRARVGRGDDAGVMSFEMRTIAREMAIAGGFCDGAFECERDYEVHGPEHEPTNLL